MVLPRWCCSGGAAVVVLLQWCCRGGAAAVVVPVTLPVMPLLLMALPVICRGGAGLFVIGNAFFFCRAAVVAECCTCTARLSLIMCS